MKTKSLLQLLFAAILLLNVSCAVKKPFDLVLLPDTQTYSRAIPEIFQSQTAWIAAHADSIAFVLHQGDITDWNVPEEWEVAAKAMQVMDGKVPYTFLL